MHIQIVGSFGKNKKVVLAWLADYELSKHRSFHKINLYIKLDFKKDYSYS
jgi:hypothetical protein